MGEIKLSTVSGLNDYIEMLLELTIMNHEREPRGYTDPQEKQYRLGQRDSLLKIQKYIKPPKPSPLLDGESSE